MWATLVHKWCVLLAGLRIRAPFWRLVIHDWTKFTPAEAPHYGRRFYGRNVDQLAFAQAWNHHHKSHPHHWEYWIPVTAHRLSPVRAGEPLPMPEWAVREMVADWVGASRSYEGFWPQSLDEWDWLRGESSKMRFHANTEQLLKKVLEEYFSNPLR